MREGNKLEERIKRNINAIFALYKYEWSTSKKKTRAHYLLLVTEYIIRLYSIRKGIVGDSSRYIRNSAYYLPHIEQMKKKEIIEVTSSIYKIDQLQKQQLITRDELPLTEKQRQKLRKKIEVKRSEAKLLTVHKLDSQMSK